MNKTKSIVNRFLQSLKVTILSVGVIGLLIIGIILISRIPCAYDDFKYNKFRNLRPFNSEKWKKAFLKSDGKEIDFLDQEQNQRFDRCYMYKDLIKKQLHFDMSYEEVKDLLGIPEEVIYFVNPDMKCIYYFLGYCTKSSCGYNPVSDLEERYIFLYFDKNLKLIAYGRQYEELGSITYDKRLLLKETKRLFSCNTKSGYYKTVDCVRTTEKITKTGGVSTDFEYCKREEVKTKWGYALW